MLRRLTSDFINFPKLSIHVLPKFNLFIESLQTEILNCILHISALCSAPSIRNRVLCSGMLLYLHLINFKIISDYETVSVPQSQILAELKTLGLVGLFILCEIPSYFSPPIFWVYYFILQSLTTSKVRQFSDYKTVSVPQSQILAGLKTGGLVGL